ncbi:MULTISPECIES: hypothetical protein [unclassified Myroides]|uniref:hypothetical protein n=1 Tax=unclassified Myroides TaxID=2642485 RepID=UPI003D2F8E06
MKNIILVFLFFMTLTIAKSQVVIGSDLKSERGAVLDLKNQEANATNSTATQGGLLLPRVALVNLYTLEPFVSTTDIAWMDAIAKDKLTREHVGLEVYNVTNNAEFKPGTYVWNGAMWERLFKEIKDRVANRIVFPLPAFNLPLINSSNIESKRMTVDLYQIYTDNIHSNNFITSMVDKENFIVTNYYREDELDYVVTHYDKDVITIHNISNRGVMDYTVHNINPGPSSFLNIYLVVHEGKEKK